MRCTSETANGTECGGVLEDRTPYLRYDFYGTVVVDLFCQRCGCEYRAYAELGDPELVSGGYCGLHQQEAARGEGEL